MSYTHVPTSSSGSTFASSTSMLNTHANRIHTNDANNASKDVPPTLGGVATNENALPQNLPNTSHRSNVTSTFHDAGNDPNSTHSAFLTSAPYSQITGTDSLNNVQHDHSGGQAPFNSWKWFSTVTALNDAHPNGDARIVNNPVDQEDPEFGMGQYINYDGIPNNSAMTTTSPEVVVESVKEVSIPAEPTSPPLAEADPLFTPNASPRITTFASPNRSPNTQFGHKEQPVVNDEQYRDAGPEDEEDDDLYVPHTAPKSSSSPQFNQTTSMNGASTSQWTSSATTQGAGNIQQTNFSQGNNVTGQGEGGSTSTNQYPHQRPEHRIVSHIPSREESIQGSSKDVHPVAPSVSSQVTHNYYNPGPSNPGPSQPVQAITHPNPHYNNNEQQTSTSRRILVVREDTVVLIPDGRGGFIQTMLRDVQLISSTSLPQVNRNNVDPRASQSSQSTQDTGYFNPQSGNNAQQGYHQVPQNGTLMPQRGVIRPYADVQMTAGSPASAQNVLYYNNGPDSGQPQNIHPLQNQQAMPLFPRNSSQQCKLSLQRTSTSVDNARTAIPSSHPPPFPRSYSVPTTISGQPVMPGQPILSAPPPTNAPRLIPTPHASTSAASPVTSTRPSDDSTDAPPPRKRRRGRPVGSVKKPIAELPPNNAPFPILANLPLDDPRRIPPVFNCGDGTFQCLYGGAATSPFGCGAAGIQGQLNMDLHMSVHAKAEEMMLRNGYLTPDKIWALLWIGKTSFTCTERGCQFTTQGWLIDGVMDQHEKECHEDIFKAKEKLKQQERAKARGST